MCMQVLPTDAFTCILDIYHITFVARAGHVNTVLTVCMQGAHVFWATWTNGGCTRGKVCWEEKLNVLFKYMLK